MKINQLKAGVVLSYLSMGIGGLITILYTPVMVRLLGQSEYGVYTLAGSVVSYLSLLSFGFGSAYVRFFSRYKADSDEEGLARLNGMFMTVFLAIGLLALLAGGALVGGAGLLFGSKLTAEELQTTRILMSLLVVNIALSFPFSVFSSFITANEEYFFQRVLSLIKAVANPFLTLPVLLLGYRSVGMVIVTVLLNIAIEILYMLFCLKKLRMRFSFRQFDFKVLKEIGVFSSFIFINIVVDQINWNLDKLLLGAFHGSVATAVYGLAAQLNVYYQQFSTSVSSVFIPRVNALVFAEDADRRLTELFVKIGRIQFIILSLIASGLVLFGRPFLDLWGGEGYADSYPIALLLILPVTIPLCQNIGIEIQRAKNMHKFRSIVYLFIAGVNLILSIPLCKLFSGVGCAIGTALALLLGNGVIMNLYYYKKMHLDIPLFWREIARLLPALILPIAFGLLLSHLFDLYHIVPLAAAILCYTAVFLISFWFFGLNAYEKSVLRRPFQKARRA